MSGEAVALLLKHIHDVRMPGDLSLIRELIKQKILK